MKGTTFCVSSVIPLGHHGCRVSLNGKSKSFGFGPGRPPVKPTARSSRDASAAGRCLLGSSGCPPEHRLPPSRRHWSGASSTQEGGAVHGSSICSVLTLHAVARLQDSCWHLRACACLRPRARVAAEWRPEAGVDSCAGWLPSPHITLVTHRLPGLELPRCPTQQLAGQGGEASARCGARWPSGVLLITSPHPAAAAGQPGGRSERLPTRGRPCGLPGARSCWPWSLPAPADSAAAACRWQVGAAVAAPRSGGRRP